MGTVTRRGAARLIMLLPALLVATPVGAESPMRVLEMRPAARSVMSGNRQEFFVRFSHPVDHYISRLMILRDGQVLLTLRPRLDSSPDTLYAAAGNLPAGAYALRWMAKSGRDGTVLEGELPFSVR